MLATGSAAVVPDTAYLIPLEAPAATIELVRGVWAARARTAAVAAGGSAVPVD